MLKQVIELVRIKYLEYKLELSIREYINIEKRDPKFFIKCFDKNKDLWFFEVDKKTLKVEPIFQHEFLRVQTIKNHCIEKEKFNKLSEYEKIDTLIAYEQLKKKIVCV